MFLRRGRDLNLNDATASGFLCFQLAKIVFLFLVFRLVKQFLTTNGAEKKLGGDFPEDGELRREK